MEKGHTLWPVLHMHMKTRHLPTMSNWKWSHFTFPYSQRTSTVRKTRNVGDSFAPNSREQLPTPPEGYTPSEVQQILQRGTALLQPTQQIIHTLVHPPAKQTPTRVSAHAQIDCDLTFQQNTSGRKVCIPWVRHSRWGCTVTYITALYRKVVEYSEKFVPSLGRGHSSSSEKQ